MFSDFGDSYRIYRACDLVTPSIQPLFCSTQNSSIIFSHLEFNHVFFHLEVNNFFSTQISSIFSTQNSIFSFATQNLVNIFLHIKFNHFFPLQKSTIIFSTQNSTIFFHLEFNQFFFQIKSDSFILFVSNLFRKQTQKNLPRIHFIWNNAMMTT